MIISLPEYAQPLFKPMRYKVLYGGRGSGKSYSVARALLALGTERRLKIMCAREFQNSINDSVHSLLADQIISMQLEEKYIIRATSIIGTNGTEFMFKGVRMNVKSIKSIPDIDILWLEEADTISNTSWETLIPTIRKDGSEIWVTYNPCNEDDPTHVKFVNTKEKMDDVFLKKANWTDNPWFPEVLKKEKDYMYKTDPDLALHVWEGECRSHSDAQIFKNKWEYRYFDVKPFWDGPYFGADWGFSVDPTTLVKVYIDPVERNLMIRNEAYGHGVDIDDIPALFDKIKDSRERMIRGDSSRPETINYISRQGFMIEAAEKWSGSVEDGIEWIKSFNKVIIHTDCPHMRDEARNYSYKVDRLTSDITTDIVDKHNHCWDAVRYACQPIIRAGNIGILDVL